MKQVDTRLLSLKRLVIYSRIADPGVGPSMVSVSPSNVTGPVVSLTPPNANLSAWPEANTPFLPKRAVVKFPLITSIRCSVQQMNSVKVEITFSLPRVLGFPP